MKLVIFRFFFYNLLFCSVQFHLEEGGDLIWIVPPALEQESLPFFSCETFVVSVIVMFIYVLTDKKFTTMNAILILRLMALPVYSVFI